MSTLINESNADASPPPPEPEWWHPEEAASLGRIVQENIRSFGQVLLAQGYTPEEGRIAIEKYMREKQQVANTAGTALSSTPEQEALRSFEAQLFSHGHTPEQVRQITGPLAALSNDHSIDVAEAEEAALKSIQAFTAMHVTVPAPAQAQASEPVEEEYQAAQRAKSVVEANAARLCAKARALHAKWKESEAKAKEAQAHVVEEERLQQIQRKRNKKTRRRARKTMDAISARSFLAEVEYERDAESAAATKLQARWRGRTFRRQAEEWRDKENLDKWEAINDRKRKAATRNRMRALADDLSPARPCKNVAGR